MRFNCNKYKVDITQWHKWFAWHPVKVKANECRWLEIVERRVTYMSIEYIEYEYRAIKDDS
jgi:hypothetical protein